MPRATVVNKPVAPHIGHNPSKPVWVRFPVVERDRHPHLVEARSLVELFRVKRLIPFGLQGYPIDATPSGFGWEKGVSIHRIEHEVASIG